MILTRRQFHRLSLMGGSALVLSSTRIGDAIKPLTSDFTNPMYHGLASPTVEPFTRPLVISPVLAPEYSDDSMDFYQLTMRQADVEIIPGKKTTIWGYNGL